MTDDKRRAQNRAAQARYRARRRGGEPHETPPAVVENPASDYAVITRLDYLITLIERLLTVENPGKVSKNVSNSGGLDYSGPPFKGDPKSNQPLPPGDYVINADVSSDYVSNADSNHDADASSLIPRGTDHIPPHYWPSDEERERVHALNAKRHADLAELHEAGIHSRKDLQ